jgi:hypothetical protein
MRYILLILTALVLLPDLASAQSCRELRKACEMKDQLGERGQGNCKLYRSQCQQPDCASLRQACLMKDQLGERGAGNCKAYRAQCTRT